MPTIRCLIEHGAGRLASAGVEAPRREAWLLLGQACGRTRAALMAASRDDADPLAIARFDELLMRRAGGEPFAYIMGEKEFWSLRFLVSSAVLVPRPDSETVVEAALDLLPENGRRRLLDLGTGSGCLLLAILSERPEAFGVGVDLSPEALAIARLNAERLGVAQRAAFVVSDWASALDGTFDVIISNPPYIADGDLQGLAPEVGHEPRLALTGGLDGLDAYRAIARQAPALMRAGGWICLEVGVGQAGPVAALLREAGIEALAMRRDLAGIARCVVGRMHFE